tara:strand:- start:4592 stop:5182 length:591 start_codon:yes stop_codon:yes gene_type:complete
MDIQQLKQKVNRYGKDVDEFIPGKRIIVNDRMQINYTYTLSEPFGKNFHEGFNPAFTPVEILLMGAFEGKYLNDCYKEFPKQWYTEALKANKLSPTKANPLLNCFRIKSRQSLKIWQSKGWTKLHSKDKDIRGWFQWYCRYYIGRRVPEVDIIQIKRWRSFKRHAGQIKSGCTPGDLKCRPKQRQALLQWAYVPFI